MTISNPTLFPMPGYVEVEIDGIRQYMPTQSTVETQTLLEKNRVLQSMLDATIQSNANLEDCLIEMAGIVYA